MGAVDVAVEIEKMHFQQRPRPAHGRPDAEIGDAGPRLVGQAADLDGKDPGHRQGVVLDADIGRGEPELAADLVAVRDLAVDDVGAPQQACRVFHVAGCQRPAHAGTGHPFAVDRNTAHRFDSESMRGTGSLQQREIASAPLAEAKIVTNDQMASTQAVDQHLRNELVGRQRREAGVEAADHGLLDTGIGQQFELFAESRQARRRRGRAEEFARVRFEGKNGGWQTGLARDIAQAAQQGTMPAMHAVEIADRQCRRPWNRARKAAKNPHLMPKKMGDYNGL